MGDDSLRRLARLLDSAFRIPGTRIRFGLDPIVGLVPGLGDLLTPLLTVAVLWHARARGVPRVVQLRMLLNVAIDVVIGVVPVLGDLFDVAWKANDRNIALLERHARGPGAATRGDWLFVAATMAALALLAAVPVVLGLWILGLVFASGA